MKHIKTFESQNLKELKKYVVWKMKFVLVILEVVYQDDGAIQLKRLYKYLPEVEFKRLRIRETDQDMYTFSEEEVKENVIYESDNLDDCLDVDLLYSLFNADKYNL